MSCVLDASAVLAFLNEEPGGEKVAQRFGGAMICMVNVAEVGSKLIEAGMSPQAAREVFDLLGLTVVPLDQERSWDIAALRVSTRSAGLSLGDRACLSLAMREDVPALTTDRAWSGLKLDCQIEPLR